jgi:hypothetical protein
VAYSYLTKDNVFDRYEAACKYTEKLTTPFPEFERIARNRPSDKIDPNFPKTTDGTTASIIRKTPRRIIQQLPTGEVENDTDDWLSVVADFILTNKVLLYANEEYDLLQKCWGVVEGGLSFGAVATYAPFLNHDGYMCPDVTLIYWGDIKLQPGKKSGRACKYLFVRSWWQKEDIEALIDQEKKLAKSAKKRKEVYDGSWDIKALEDLLDANARTVKKESDKTPVERERNVNSNGIEMVTGFQTGIGATFLTVNPSSKIVVRSEKNEDPRGKMPVDWMYGDIDGANPFGRGIIELVGGLQNLIDADMQMYQYNRALMLAPPLIQYGNVNNVRLTPNAVMKATDPNARIETIKIDTTAVANYPALYGLQKSQLLNLVNSPDTSISADVGNPGFSKTPTGINQQKATISVDDNYVRKMFEAWFEDWCETAINIYFAKRHGIEELQLDDDTIEELSELADKGKFDLNLINEAGQIRIDYDTATPALKFRVDASSSKMKDDQDQLQALGLLQQALDGSQVLAGVVPPEKVIGLWNSLVQTAGVENPEDLKVDVAQFQQQQAEQQQLAAQQAQAQTAKAQTDQMALQQQAQQPQRQPQGPGMPPQGAQQPSVAPEDEAIIQELTSLGVSDNVIAEAINMLENGANPDDVLAALGVTGAPPNG